MERLRDYDDHDEQDKGGQVNNGGNEKPNRCAIEGISEQKERTRT